MVATRSTTSLHGDSSIMQKTLGQLIDELTITNLKIWMLEDKKRDNIDDDKIVADATRKTNELNPYRNQLISEIDKLTIENFSGNNIKIYGK